MTGLLTIAAAVTTLILLVSATNAAARATARDPHLRGPWGIANFTSVRNRPLNPHQRRWQTALLSARDNNTRWGDLVAEIQTLERLANTTHASPPPSSYDGKWIEASIANLEQAIQQPAKP